MAIAPLLTPEDAVLVLVDEQAGLAFAAGSADVQALRSNAVAVARTAMVFQLPVVVSISAAQVFGGPLMPQVQAALPGVTPIERHNMNLWEDATAKAAVKAVARPVIVIAGLLTEACVSFPVLSALAEGYRVHVVADACGALTKASHLAALHRMEQAGAVLTSWLQLVLELQRDWTRHDTYEAARGIIVDHGGGYGIGLDYARAMIPPSGLSVDATPVRFLCLSKPLDKGFAMTFFRAAMLSTATALLTATAPSALAKPSSSETKPVPQAEGVTVVLVHGAWADGSSWSKVIPLLQAKGIKVLGVQNPLTSLADDVAATKRVLADVTGPVVLVGHSWAGTVITEAGTDPKVKALVYVAAFANKDGQSGGELVAAYPKPPALSTVADDGHGFLRQTEEGMVKNFAPDLPVSEARTLFVTQGPLAASTFGDKVTDAAWKTRPSWYVVSADDRVIAPQMERDLALMMKAKTTVLKSSHVSLLSHPHEVAAVIEDAVAAVGAAK